MSATAVAETGRPGSEVEEVPCLVCGGTETSLLHRARDRRFRVDRTEFSLRRCRGCGHVFLSPRPVGAALGRYYPGRFYAPRLDASGDDAGYQRKSAPRVAEKLAIVEGAAPPAGRWVDVGCAAGEFLAAARERGIEVAGIEFDADTAAWVREQRGIPVTTGSVESVELPADAAVYTFWASLEHLPDPGLALRRVRAALKPDGVVVILVPNVDSWEARLAGRHWPHLDVPRHLHHFRAETLSRLLEREGYRVESVATPETVLATDHWPSVLLRGLDLPVRVDRALRRTTSPVLAALRRAAARRGRNHTLIAVGRR